LSEAAARLAAGDLAARVPAARSSGDEIDDLARTFNAMAESLERTERLRRNIVSDVAHELRTPLTHMRCRIEAVEEGVERATPELFRALHASTLTLGRLVDDLQELALAESGALRLDRRAEPLGPIVGQALETVAPLARERGVELACAVPEPLVAPVDRRRIVAVLVNLLDNAVRHTPRGGRVELSGVGSDDEIVLGVSDTGEGIAPEHLAHLFERFFRVDPSRSRSSGGAGLGLAIAKALVEAHGGRIAATSELRRGTRVEVRLPRA
jgi:signal transduction histidine kinase